MADKVEYGKIVVQVDQIMLKLHEVAKENAKVEQDGYSIFNSLIDTDSPAEGTNPTIILRKAEPIDVREKHDFFKKIQDYVKYFAGENYAQKITEDNLVPIFTNDNLDGDETSSETPSEPKPTSESLHVGRLFINSNERMAFKVVEHMFNDNPGVILFEESEPSSGESATDGKPEDKVYGYAVQFLFYKGGQSINHIGMGDKGKRFLSGVWADLANMKIKTLGGGEIPIGGAFAKVTRFFKRTEININDADNFVRNIIKNDYPQSSAIVRAYDTKSLKSYLMKSDQWNPDYENLFTKKCEYAITIEVEVKDKAYEQFSKETVANICTRAFGDALKIAHNPFNSNKVKPDQVIKIQNYQSEFRDQSMYNRRSGGNDGASATNESLQSFAQHVRNGYVESILESMFRNNDILTEEEKKRYFKIRFFVENPLTGKKDKANPSYEKVERGKRIDPSKIPSLSSVPDIDGYKKPEKWEPDPTTLDGTKDENHCIARYIKDDGSAASPETSSETSSTTSPETSSETSSTTSSEISSDAGDALISVDFRIKDPTKENAISHSQGIAYAKPEQFKNSGNGNDRIPQPIEYEGYRFRFWNPDPNEFKTNPSRREDGKTTYYPNVSNAEYVKDDNSGKGHDFYIVPHECLVSKNRKDDYEIANDGTVTAKRSKQDYKGSDFTR